MSHLIRTRRPMTSTPSLTATPSSTTILTTAATAPAEMDHRLVNPVHSDGPPVPQAQASSTSSKNTRGPCRQLKMGTVTRVTNGPPTTEQHSALAHDIGHVVRTFCPMLWKSWKAMLEETKITLRNQLSISYNLEHMDEDKFAYVNQLFSERYKQWKSDMHQCFQEFDDPQVALEEGCPKELEDRQDSWKAKANKINQEKKTLLHHSGSRPFSYRMEARRKEGSKFSKIDVFADVYVRPGNELT
ncbi:unnamed protein product [Malus baccata var. baccata]